MRDFLFSVISKASQDAGIKCVIEMPDGQNATLPRPRVEVDFLPSTYIPTGRKIAKRTEDGKQVTVNERYEIDSPVMLFLRDNDDGRIALLSRSLVMSFPKGVADKFNNWVRIRASQADWSGFKAPTVGISRIEPLKSRTFSVRVGFTWRLTYETVTPYITQFNLKGAFNE